MELSKSQHTLELVKELLDDLELGSTSGEQLILKASRLARIAGDEEIKQWLKFELGGYNGRNNTSIKYMGITGRWINKDKKEGFWASLAQIEAKIEAEKSKLAVMRIPDDNHNLAAQTTAQTMSNTANEIAMFSGIRSKVKARLHSFVSEVYYEKVFDNLSESIFESYKKDVDNLISASCGS